ncbi:polysaccharide deacetylase family protein [Eubacterium sp. MSJ-13]|uniref:polysaccharide deacetylase family protein n=1 Tax=Eubacterium sp. MSJ-13 TaxID=2841513 RepID=UPI001C11ED95|nr:polysaccharide deacetylase family protein [Eubacterium sp. MSJ-13]MBU5478670.1 polysaccharide deacetylase family protein [Eubacterium sp. MSJ-13]
MKKYKKALTFSYDDGIEQDRKLVEIFNRYGLKATFNLNTGIQTPESNFEIEGVHINRMKQDGLAELYRGHEIATHGLTHAAPTGMTKEQLDEEFIKDAKNIERIYGTYPVGMAYAYGCVDDTVAEYLKTIGIKYGRTVESSHSFEIPKEPIKLKATCHHDDEMLFELAEKFLKAEPKEDEPMLFYVWGHSYEFDVNNNWDRIEKFCKMMSGRDDIFYGTNRECLV